MPALQNQGSIDLKLGSQQPKFRDLNFSYLLVRVFSTREDLTKPANIASHKITCHKSSEPREGPARCQWEYSTNGGAGTGAAFVAGRTER